MHQAPLDHDIHHNVPLALFEDDHSLESKQTSHKSMLKAEYCFLSYKID